MPARPYVPSSLKRAIVWPSAPDTKGCPRTRVSKLATIAAEPSAAGVEVIAAGDALLGHKIEELAAPSGTGQRPSGEAA